MSRMKTLVLLLFVIVNLSLFCFVTLPLLSSSEHLYERDRDHRTERRATNNIDGFSLHQHSPESNEQHSWSEDFRSANYDLKHSRIISNTVEAINLPRRTDYQDIISDVWSAGNFTVSNANVKLNDTQRANIMDMIGVGKADVKTVDQVSGAVSSNEVYKSSGSSEKHASESFQTRKLSVPDIGYWLRQKNGTKKVLEREQQYGRVIKPRMSCGGRATQSDNNTPEGRIEENINVQQQPYLLVIVCSSVLNFERRQAIRETWGSSGSIRDNTHERLEKVVDKERDGVSNARVAYRIIFVLALPDEVEHERLTAYVTDESSTYGDILQLNFTDHRANLSLKTLGAMSWAAEECETARFLLKTDDDVFVNVPNLMRLMTSEPSISTDGSEVIVGHVIHDAQPVRDRTAPYYTPYSVFRGRQFPPYTSGSGYLVSSAAVVKLVNLISQRSNVFWLEDVFITGMLAKELRLPLLHDSRFNYSRRRRTIQRDDCWYHNIITQHRLTPEELYTIWTHTRWTFQSYLTDSALKNVEPKFLLNCTERQ